MSIAVRIITATAGAVGPEPGWLLDEDGFALLDEDDVILLED